MNTIRYEVHCQQSGQLYKAVWMPGEYVTYMEYIPAVSKYIGVPIYKVPEQLQCAVAQFSILASPRGRATRNASAPENAV